MERREFILSAAMSRKMLCTVAGALALAFFGCSSADKSAEADVRVSPDGAVRTLQAAVDAVRELRASGRILPGRMARIAVAPGTYRLEKTLEVAADVAPVAFAGPETGEAILSGGRTLGPFTAGKDGVWTCDVPAGLVFEQLWVNGTRAIRARSPNTFYHYVMEAIDKGIDPSTGRPALMGRRLFRASEGAVEPILKSPKEEWSDVVIHLWWAWSTEFRRLQTVDAEKNRICLSADATREFFFWTKYCPRFTIENCRGALDAPGEWFLDRRASKLLYIPRAGERPETTTAVAPVLDALVEVKGAKGVSFRNLTFSETGWRMPKNGHYASQSAIDGTGQAIRVTDSEEVSFASCRIRHTATCGLCFDAGTHRSSVTHTLFEDLGSGGVRVGAETWSEKDPPARLVTDVTVDDNIIHDGGHVFPAGTGIHVTFAKNCRITHNEICDLYYSGVSCGWRWGYRPAPNRDNEISWNHVHHLGKGVLSDMGFIYTLGDSRGTVIAGNHGHDIFSYDYTGSGGNGLYVDEGSQGVLWTSNLIHHTKTCALFQHFGRDNRFVNNVFAVNTKPDTAVAGRARVEAPHSLIVSNNVFVWTAGRQAWRRPALGKGNDDLVFGRNLWWSPDPVAADAFDGGTFETWQKDVDRESRLADPLFVSWKDGDWRLRSESPAFALGFKAWDYTRAGVRKEDAAWRRLAESIVPAGFAVAPVPPLNPGRRSQAVDFELLKPGDFPKGFFMGSSSRAKGFVRCTDRTSRKGRQALEFCDFADLPQAYLPFVSQDVRMASDRFRLSFSIKCDAKADFCCEWRENTKAAKNGHYAIGPQMSVRGGKMSVRGLGRTVEIAGYRPDTWIDVVFSVRYDQNGVGTWEFEATPAGGTAERVTDLAFLEKECRRPNWIGLISHAKCETTTVIDEWSYENL